MKKRCREIKGKTSSCKTNRPRRCGIGNTVSHTEITPRGDRRLLDRVWWRSRCAVRERGVTVLTNSVSVETLTQAVHLRLIHYCTPTVLNNKKNILKPKKSFPDSKMENPWGSTCQGVPVLAKTAHAGCLNSDQASERLPLTCHNRGEKGVQSTSGCWVCTNFPTRG